ncbi:uncharacterized protein ASCRUDRAFT_129419 [Ascoidea rubescens DSM 1968]|uniref:Uncharacterized protein n=1 Tax=Ascoidea rubescens DSM 1968 TaxID=1344418 RepID=A0A1D2V9D3_9ASCO|nr:hypothetical protein ASCRUDRAFT_129419 [Ascoidea rubescens DSM 1968]ODV58063.1 hypothetical protein ASCRUDRAFT_129419 [Ascoidea rubescens DSM 1968]
MRASYQIIHLCVFALVPLRSAPSPSKAPRQWNSRASRSPRPSRAYLESPKQ